MASKYQLKLGDRDVEVEVEENEGDAFILNLDGVSIPASLVRIGESAHYSLIVDNRPHDIFAEETPQGYRIVIGAHAYNVVTRRTRPTPGARPGPAAPEAGGEWVLTSPMGGVVQEVLVSPGDEVEAGAVVVVIEAMKMQNEVRSRRAGTVNAVYVSVGEHVEQGTPLVVLL
jgi:biotin carboxyl carrier protein